MKIKTKYPFDDYNGYLITNRENRKHVCLVPKTGGGKRTTISYARYLMSVKLKRRLEKHEQADHIDEDKTNDRLSNIQILSKGENIKKHSQYVGQKYIAYTCPGCGKRVDIPYFNSFACKKNRFGSCSRACTNIVLSKKYSLQELSDLGQKSIIKIYTNKS